MKTIKLFQTFGAALVFLAAADWQTALADQSACVLMKYERVDNPDTGHTVYNAVPIFPNLVPPVPIPTYPLNPLVVEGNDGQFVKTGSNATNLEVAWFRWKPGNYAGAGPTVRFPFGPVVQIGATSHYEICVFQDAREKSCNQDIAPSGDNNGRGFVKLFADCSNVGLYPNDGRGLSPSSGVGTVFEPILDPANGQQVFEIFWKMRACNFSKCSDWTAKNSLFWVPPPELRDPTFTTTQNSRLTTPNNPQSDFPVTFIWEPAAGIRTGTHYVPPTARLCIASPGQRCTNGGTDPLALDDPWVLFVNVPNNAIGGVAITGTVEYLDRHQSIFGFAGETVHWTAANCWTLPSGRIVCVYNNNVRAVTFLP